MTYFNQRLSKMLHSKCHKKVTVLDINILKYHRLLFGNKSLSTPYYNYINTMRVKQRHVFNTIEKKKPFCSLTFFYSGNRIH